MALRDAIRTLSEPEQWTDVQRRLCPEDGQQIIAAVRALTQHPEDDDLMFDLVARLAEVLPHDHPILAAIAIEDVRSTTTPRVWAEVIERLTSATNVPR